MSEPISPPPVSGEGGQDLPAYVSNGLIGLRVRCQPLQSGMALVSGYVGEDPERGIEAAAPAPYPLAGDIAVNGVWLSDLGHQVVDLEQAYDFSCGELTSRFVFAAQGRRIDCTVLTFASREDPTLVCQELTVRVDGACDLQLRGGVSTAGVLGRALRFRRDTPGEGARHSDGTLLWESAGKLGRLGLAYVTEISGGEAKAIEPKRPALDGSGLITTYGFRAQAGKSYHLRQIASLTPSAMHTRPDEQAGRMVAKAAFDGFDTLRVENRAAWKEIWKGRIQLVGAEPRWQASADAAFFYLNSSVHSSSCASTSIFGLATWHDYHYYYGHVMWDIEAFAVPVLSLVQPQAAASLLDYRFRNLDRARANAKLMGRLGAQFPWESSPSWGEEAAPLPGTAAWHEDHVSLDVSRAFALHADVTGQAEFRRDRAWPVLSGVAEWIVSRVHRTDDGYAIRASMGIAERALPVDNAAFTNMAAVVVLNDTIRCAERTGRQIDPEWRAIAAGMTLPRRGEVVLSHDGYRKTEEKGATPDPLMGLWPFGFPLPEAQEQATLAFYLDQADRYLGSPMLSALYGAWAARTGDRALALKMLEEGYAKFESGRFGQILEYRPDKFPDQPRAGPFFANMGGFLSGLLLGFPRLEPGDEAPETWPCAPVVLPTGWEAIEVDRLWVRGKPMKLVARHGQVAELQDVSSSTG
ncbi:glycoside hydrolase family 65 protein [Caulobacter sp.]|uniref:glycoside hydrolase family 65 protein n=1 Tax=Caulobacter sp. TaxID=78 RepID=UPI001B1B3AA4|nr:glycoside hydrolase family 65 protein [Caulobacter sp.]MBO9547155.1 glycoside hydrolase family 65 protein [Caulobacter sp.]